MWNIFYHIDKCLGKYASHKGVTTQFNHYCLGNCCGKKKNPFNFLFCRFRFLLKMNSILCAHMENVPHWEKLENVAAINEVDLESL